MILLINFKVLFQSKLIESHFFFTAKKEFRNLIQLPVILIIIKLKIEHNCKTQT